MLIIKTRKKNTHTEGGSLHGQRSSLENEWFELHIGHPRPGVQHWEDKSPWLFRGLVVLTEELREA